MNSKVMHMVILIIALAIAYIGFRFVTQAGQGLDAVQNDGYGGTGGVMILLAGFILGVLWKEKLR